MENTTKLLLNHLLCHLMLIPAFIYGEWWMFVISFLIWYTIAIVAISGGYHRYYSHKSFVTGKWYEYAVNILGLFSGAGSALVWTGTHRQHHACSDTIDDPHSYIHKGIPLVYFSTWGYGFKLKKRFIVKLLENEILRFFHTYYFKMVFAVVISLLLIDPLVLIFGYAIPIVFAFHSYGFLNVVGHTNGKPSNSWLANILTAGEGWHQNHHDDSNNYKIGRTRWQFDPTARFIELIKH